MTSPDDRRLLTPEEYREAQNSAEFRELRRRFRRFAFPMTVAFLAWYLLYVLLSTYAPSVMETAVFGSVNLGILLGLGQFVSTFLITQLYVSYSTRKVDPIRDEMGERLEHHEYAHGAKPTEGATRA